MPMPRKSVEQHIKDGTYRPDRHGPRPTGKPAKDAPCDAQASALRKPAELTGAAGKVWDQLVAVLGDVVRDRDGLILADLCRWWAELKRVQATLETSSPGEKGYNQLLIAAGICSDKLDKLASRFGLTPADRSKLRIVETGPPVAKVPTKPKTRLDLMGPPTSGKT